MVRRPRRRSNRRREGDQSRGRGHPAPPASLFRGGTNPSRVISRITGLWTPRPGGDAVLIATRTKPVVRATEMTPDRKRRRLPATRLPVAREDRRGWSVLSAAMHALIIFLLVGDFALHTADVKEIPQGAGGPGPAGGGGGGHRGTGDHARVTYVRMVAATQQPVVKAIVPPVVPPVVPPPPKPEPKPVVQQVAMKLPEITQPTPAELKIEGPKVPDSTAAQSGTGGGTGRDGSAGNGPGTGGGNGSGTGTG